MATNSSIHQFTDMVTMNVSGRFKGTEIRRYGQHVLNTILQEKSVEVFFGQQINFRPNPPKNYEMVGGSKAHIIYDMSMYRAFDDKSFRHKLKDLQLMGTIPFHYLPDQNYAICKLKSNINPKCEFIALSWVTDECLGPHRGRSLLKKLCTFIVNLAALEGLPVILGGTFRVPLEVAAAVVPDELCCYGYDPLTPRRAMRSSNFFITSRSVTLNDVEPFICSGIDVAWEGAKRGQFLNPEDAFYFDPVCATANLAPFTHEPNSFELVNGITSEQPESEENLANGGTVLVSRRASSFQNLYFDEELMENALLCTVS